MIHHVSIPAREPQYVAEVLAELMGGKCYPFDIPKNDDQVVFGNNESPAETWPFHVLLSKPLEPEQIDAIGAREGWRAKTFDRGMRGRKPFFHYRVLEME